MIWVIDRGRVGVHLALSLGDQDHAQRALVRHATWRVLLVAAAAALAAT